MDVVVSLINIIHSPAHSFYLCKLDIVEVILLDFYGGPHYVTKDDYYKADLDTLELSGMRLMDTNTIK